MTQTAIKFTPTNQMIAACKSTLMAIAYTQTVRPIVEGYQKKNLEIIKPLDDEGKLITDLKHTYRMNDKDFNDYLDFCHEDAIKNGFEVKERGYCPLLIAENLERQSKRLLIDVMKDHTGLEGLDADKLICSGLDNYNKAVELTLNLLTKYVKF